MRGAMGVLPSRLSELGFRPVICAALLAHLLVGGLAAKCNGAEQFCELPLANFTFPGTHNAGAYGLTVPSTFPSVSLCYWLNHSRDPVGQLALGARFLSLDMCDKDSEPGVAYNCHAQKTMNDNYTAFGGKMVDTLKGIKSWMKSNPEEIIVLHASDVFLEGDRASLWLQTVQGVFGTCDDLAAPAVSLGCMVLSQLPSKDVTLGALQSRGRRVLVLPVGQNFITDTWNSKYGGITVQGLLDYHNKLANDASANSTAANRLWMFSLFRSQKIPELSSLKCDGIGCVIAALTEIGTIQLQCNSQIAFDTNQLVPASTGKRPYGEQPYQKSGAVCDGYCGCRGYYCSLEVAHQVLLDKGYGIFAMLVDYQEYGNVADTAYRMNQANWRRFKGQPEPGYSWIECNWKWIVGVSVPLVVLSIMAMLVYIFRIRPAIGRRCCDACCPWRARQRAAKEERMAGLREEWERNRAKHQQYQQQPAYPQQPGYGPQPVYTQQALHCQQQMPPGAAPPTGSWPAGNWPPAGAQPPALYPAVRPQAYGSSAQAPLPTQSAGWWPQASVMPVAPYAGQPGAPWKPHLDKE